MEMESRYTSNWTAFMKGLDKNIAQEHFIKEAENMGISTVKWEKNNHVTDIVPWQGCGWPAMDNTAEHGKTWSTAGKKLSSRSEILSISTVSGHERRDLLSTSTQGLIWNCLVLLSRLCCSLWTSLPPAKSGVAEGGRNGRLHARAWKKSWFRKV